MHDRAHVERLQIRKVRESHPFSDDSSDINVEIYNKDDYKGFALEIKRKPTNNLATAHKEEKRKQENKRWGLSELI